MVHLGRPRPGDRFELVKDVCTRHLSIFQGWTIGFYVHVGEQGLSGLYFFHPRLTVPSSWDTERETHVNVIIYYVFGRFHIYYLNLHPKSNSKFSRHNSGGTKRVSYPYLLTTSSYFWHAN